MFYKTIVFYEKLLLLSGVWYTDLYTGLVWKIIKPKGLYTYYVI